MLKYRLQRGEGQKHRGKEWDRTWSLETFCVNKEYNKELNSILKHKPDVSSECGKI